MLEGVLRAHPGAIELNDEPKFTRGAEQQPKSGPERDQERPGAGICMHF